MSALEKLLQQLRKVKNAFESNKEKLAEITVIKEKAIALSQDGVRVEAVLAQIRELEASLHEPAYEWWNDHRYTLPSQANFQLMLLFFHPNTTFTQLRRAFNNACHTLTKAFDLGTFLPLPSQHSSTAKNYIDISGETPLSVIIKYGHYSPLSQTELLNRTKEFIEAVIQLSPDRLNQPLEQGNLTPLEMAVKVSNVPVTKLLLERGAIITAKVVHTLEEKEATPNGKAFLNSLFMGNQYFYEKIRQQKSSEDYNDHSPDRNGDQRAGELILKKIAQDLRKTPFVFENDDVMARFIRAALKTLSPNVASLLIRDSSPSYRARL